MSAFSSLPACPTFCAAVPIQQPPDSVEPCPMRPDPARVLRLWSVAPDHDPYQLVMAQFGVSHAKARREVRSALRFFGYRPHTSAEYTDVRQRLRKGEAWYDELV